MVDPEDLCWKRKPADGCTPVLGCHFSQLGVNARNSHEFKCADSPVIKPIMSVSGVSTHMFNDFWSEVDHDMVIIGPEDVSNFNPENVLPQPEHILDEIRAWLNPTQYEGDGSELQKHSSSCLAGTGSWIYESSAYQEWYESDEHGLLWIQGIPGSGKSVLASNLIHSFFQENVPVLYFFFRHTIQANHEPEALLRDWLAQILSYSPPLQLELKTQCEKTYDRIVVESLPMVDLWKYLRKAMTYLPRVYCVIDALDEMERDHLRQLLRSLDALGQWRPSEIKLVVTGRPISVMEQELRKVKIVDVRLDKKNVEEDISRYVQHRLNISSIALESHLHVKHTVLERADGLFLYAKLALDSLLENDIDALQRLEEMPTDLTVMYENLLREHSARTGVPTSLQELVLQLVTHATRPLRLLELAEIIRFRQEDQRDLGATKDLVRAVCGPLLEILPDETIRVVHHSLTEYLKGLTPVSHSRPFPIFEPGRVNDRLAITCLSYLATGCLDQIKTNGRRTISGDVHYVEPAFLAPRQVLPPFVQYAGSNWPIHVQRAIAAGHDQTEANDMLDHIFSRVDIDKLDVLAGTKMDHPPTPLRFAVTLNLQEYAKRLLCPVGNELPRDINLDEDILLYATEKGNDFMVALLLNHGANPNVRNVFGHTALHLAVRADHVEIASLLLNAGLDPCTISGPDNFHGMPGEGEKSWTPFDWAFGHGSLEMALLFSKSLLNPNDIGNALHQAIIGRNLPVVEKLLQNQEVDVNSKIHGTSALYKASTKRDASVIELLLRNGADPNIPHNLPDNSYKLTWHPPFEESEFDPVLFGEMNRTVGRDMGKDFGENALHALAKGHYLSGENKDEEELKTCFQLLLDHGANVHQVDEAGNTPLHLAGNTVATTSLLNAHADPNAINNKGEVLLHTTFSDEILEVLIPNADLNVKAVGTWRTPLLYALLDDKTFTYAGDEQRIKKAIKLLDHGADATVADHLGNTALHLALGLHRTAELRHTLVKKLCSNQVIVDQPNHKGKTPMHMNGPGSGRRDITGHDGGEFDLEVLNILVTAGANIEIRDEQGQTPFFQFVQHFGYRQSGLQESFLDRMIEAGSRIDVHDSRGRTLLHAAASGRSASWASIDFFLAKGLNPKDVDHEGNTLLHEIAPSLAKSYVDDKMVQNLMALGIDPTTPNNSGRTPLHILSSFRPRAFDACASTSGSRPSNADDVTFFPFYLGLHQDVDCADEHGITPLHIASTFSEYLTTQLLDAGASPLKASREGLTAFHLAARSRQANIIGILLERLKITLSHEELVATLNAKDSLNRSALYYAAASGRVESVQLLINAGATPHHDAYAGSPWNGCADFEEELAKGDWTRCMDRESWRTRPVFDPGKTDCGSVLLSGSARPEKVLCESKTGPTFPSERLEEIIDLIASHASENTASLENQAIESAFEKQFHYTVEALLRTRNILNLNVRRDIDAEMERRRSSKKGLHATSASEESEKAVADLMISRDYTTVLEEVGATDCVKRVSWAGDSTLLHRFVLGGFTTLVSNAATQQNIAKVEWRQDRDHHENSTWLDVSHVHPLLVAACQREDPNMDVVRILVEEKKVDVNARMAGSHYPKDTIPNGGSALHFLAAGGHWWQFALAIPYIVEHGADMEIKDTDGLTPLGVALRSIKGPHFSKRTVETLLELGASPDGEERWGKSYLSMTIDHKEIFELFIRHNASISQPALAGAIRKKDIGLLQTMLARSADPNTRKVGYEKPERQTGENSFEMARYDPNDANEQYLLDLMAAECDGTDSDRDINERMFRMLLEYGADPFARYEKTTVLHRILENRRINAHSSGQNTYLSILLEQPGLDLETRDADGMTLLLLAGGRGFGIGYNAKLRLIQRLVNLGANVRAKDNNSRNVLHHLCRATVHFYQESSRYDDDIQWVSAHAPELLNSPDSEGRLPLHISLEGRKEVADCLVSLGTDVCRVGQDGNTPLHLILGKLVFEIDLDDRVKGLGRKLYERITDLGAEVNARNDAGETPLFAYFRDGSATAEVVFPELTSAEKAEDKYNRLYHERLHQKESQEKAKATEKEYLVFDFFDQHGADWLAVNNAGENLLHIVAQDSRDYSHTQQVGRRAKRFEFLMGKGLDPTAEDKEHRTPLDLAASLGLDEVLALFKRDE